MIIHHGSSYEHFLTSSLSARAALERKWIQLGEEMLYYYYFDSQNQKTFFFFKLHQPFWRRFILVYSQIHYLFLCLIFRKVNISLICHYKCPLEKVMWHAHQQYLYFKGFFLSSVISKLQNKQRHSFPVLVWDEGDRSRSMSSLQYVPVS